MRVNLSTRHIQKSLALTLAIWMWVGCAPASSPEPTASPPAPTVGPATATLPPTSVPPTTTPTVPPTATSQPEDGAGTSSLSGTIWLDYCGVPDDDTLPKRGTCVGSDADGIRQP